MPLPAVLVERFGAWQPTVRAAGIHAFAPGWSTQRGARADYCFYLVLAGSMRFRWAEGTAVCGAHQACLVPPGTPFVDSDGPERAGTRALVVDVHAAPGCTDEPWLRLGLPAVATLDRPGWLGHCARRLGRHPGRGDPQRDLVLRGLVDHLLGSYLLAGWEQGVFRTSWGGSSPWLGTLLDRVERGLAREDLDVATMADWAGVSRGHLSETFVRELGLPPARWLTRRRVQRACRLLASDRRLGVGEVGRRVGIPDPYRFSRTFRRVVGEAPSTWRKRG